jgi:signal transduction histidine kinase
MSFLRPLRGLTIAQQVMVLLVVALAVAMATNILIISAFPPPPRQVTEMSRVLARMDAALPELRQATAARRAKILAANTDRSMQLQIVETPPPDADNALARAIKARASERLQLPLEDVRSMAGTGQGIFRTIIESTETIKPEAIDELPLYRANQVAVRVNDNAWLVARPSRRPEERLWLNYIGLYFLGGAILLTPIALWFAQRLAAPIRRFGAAAERMGRDPYAEALPAEGPREVRGAVEAFNTMRERIRRFVADRTLMLAAISHDLRTPLQRMRFRVESLPDDVGRDILADIEEMETMLASTLAFARDDSGAAPAQQLDLGALVSSVCNDAEDAGGKAECDVSERIVVQADPVRLKRAVANLVTNAIKFGGAAEVSIAREPGFVVVTVADRGPGIPGDIRDAMFQPFRRQEPSRSKATGGVGLGLAIARTIARAHGGDITLHDREGGGLLARMALPA